MKPNTEKVLRNAILTMLKKGGYTALDFDTLYKLYLEMEIFSLKDILRAKREFCDFCRAYIAQITKDDESTVVRLTTGLYTLTHDFACLTERYMAHYAREEFSFARIIGRVVGGDVSTKILDVGCGSMPYSSILLADKGFDVTAMDPNIKYDNKFMSRMGVKSFKQEFNRSTKVGQYDIVIGKKPCSAIANIVENCYEEQVPYFIKLCKCNAPNGKVSGWVGELPKIDPNVYFYEDYAYNVSNSKFTPEKRIDRILLDETLGKE